MRKGVLLWALVLGSISCNVDLSGLDFRLQSQFPSFQFTPPNSAFHVYFTTDGDSIWNCSLSNFKAECTLTGSMIKAAQNIVITAKSSPEGATVPYFIRFYTCNLTPDMKEFTANRFEYNYPNPYQVVQGGNVVLYRQPY